MMASRRAVKRARNSKGVNIMKQTAKLLELIPKLQPIEFVGLARLLGVPVVAKKEEVAADDEHKYEPREFLDIFKEVLDAFDKLGRARQREIIKLIKKSRGDK
jgi:hypothetical protein